MLLLMLQPLLRAETYTCLLSLPKCTRTGATIQAILWRNELVWDISISSRTQSASADQRQLIQYQCSCCWSDAISLMPTIISQTSSYLWVGRANIMAASVLGLELRLDHLEFWHATIGGSVGKTLGRVLVHPSFSKWWKGVVEAVGMGSRAEASTLPYETEA